MAIPGQSASLVAWSWPEDDPGVVVVLKSRGGEETFVSVCFEAEFHVVQADPELLTLMAP